MTRDARRADAGPGVGQHRGVPSRHRAPVPVRTRGPARRRVERAGLVLAVVCSGLAALLVVEGLRTAAIAVAAVGLALALGSLLVGLGAGSRRA